jgi:hypothetical protein
VPSPTPALCDRVAVEARLLDVANSDAVAELVVVLRGTVRPWRGRGRGLWRVQLGDGQHRVVSSQSVIAVTPVRTRAGSRMQGHPEDQAADR